MRVLLCLALLYAVRTEATDDLMVVAHRGVVNDVITENSLAALEESIRRGYTHIEVDLRVTKDGHAVCLHDRNLLRTCNIDRNVDELTLAELRALVDADTVPDFETFCQRAAGRIQLMPDVKSVPPKFIDAFVASIDASMTKHDLFDEALFIGVEPVIEGFKGRGKLKWRDRLAEAKQSPRWNDDAPDNYFIFNHAADFTREEVEGFHAAGLKIVVSINTFHYREGDPIAQGLADVKRMLDLGVDGLQIDSVYDEPVFEHLRAVSP